jgi:hypothetical protein
MTSNVNVPGSTGPLALLPVAPARGGYRVPFPNRNRIEFHDADAFGASEFSPCTGGEMQGNPGAQTLGGFVGFGFAGAFIGQLWRPAAIAFAALGLARSVYSTVFAKGHDVSFAVDTPIQVRLAPPSASSKR